MRREKKSQKRSQKITEHQEAIAAKIVAFSLAQQIPQDQFKHTHMDKEAYTHHEINAKLFLPSAIRCQLTGKKSFTQIVNILIRSAQSKNNNGYRNTNNIKIQEAHIFVVAVASPFLASEPTGVASPSGLPEGAAGGSVRLSGL